MQANFPLTSRGQQISFWDSQFRRSRGRHSLKTQYSKCWKNHLRARHQYCVILSNNSVKADNNNKKKSTRLAGSSFLVVFTSVPWLTSNKIQSHIPSYTLEKVQIGCPLHRHLSLSIISLGFMLVNLPLTCLVLAQLGSKSCSYLLLTKRLRASFFCLLLPWLLSLFGLGISQMLTSEDGSQLSSRFLSRAAISSNILLKSFVIP